MSVLQEIVLPTGFTALLCLAGLAMILLPRLRERAWVPLTAGAVLLLLFGNGAFATLLMSPLEYAYPAMHEPARHPDARAIVVLTAYAAEDPAMPQSSLLNSSSAFRVIEAWNLYVSRPDCRVIVSGLKPAAALMGEQLRLLGVPAERLTIDEDSPDTADSAAHVTELLGGEPFFLVTSAGHMPRAAGVFRRQGALPIPAPTDYWLPRDPRTASWTQSSLHLQASDLAVHEYLALAWYHLSGRI